jgi:glucosamine kinase
VARSGARGQPRLNASADLVLGIDGGGTRTRAVLARTSGVVIGAGAAAGANVHDVGPAEAGRQLALATAAAHQAASVQPGRLAAACFALAGIVTDADRSLARRAIEAAGLAGATERVAIVTDGAAAVAGAHLGRPGLVLIASTGSACYGRGEGGRGWRTTGWGWLLGDEGSGYWVGREGLVAVVRAHDGRGPATALTGPLLRALECREPDELMHRVYVRGLDRAATAALGPLVVAAAEAGDPVAGGILGRAVEHLVEAVEACRAALALPRPPLALTGGLALALRDRIAAALEWHAVSAELVEGSLSPPFGAALLALELLGAAETSAQEALRSTSRRWQRLLASGRG